MGTGVNHRKKRATAGKRSFKRNIMDLKNRGRDIDRIQDDLKKIETGSALPLDEEAPGGGFYYCVECARHFINGAVLAVHKTTKGHKKRVKFVAEPQYTQKEADAGAGASAPDTGS